MKRIIATSVLAFATVIFLAACGGNKGTTSTTSTTTAGPMTEGQREAGALPLAAAKPVPAGLNCGATKPVWVNLHTKAYHEPDSPYYGKTKSGQYMCPSAAAAAGYHAAGAGHANGASGTNAEGGTTGASASPMPHRRHHRSSNSY